MTSKKKDVLNRLDSLLLQDEDGGEEAGAGNSNGDSSSSAAPKTARKKARSIRFADDDELHEIIGYSERYSDDSDDETDFRRRRSDKDDDEAPLTVEERNVINLTKKNTNFNAHAQNLMGGAPLRLGDKRHVSADDGPLLVTVRPFSSRGAPVVAELAPRKINAPAAPASGEMRELGDGGEEQHISRANFAAARLSFLNSTLAQETAAESIKKSRDKAEVVEKAAADGEEPNDCESRGERRRPSLEATPAECNDADEEVAREDGDGDELIENANAADGRGQSHKAPAAAANKPAIVKLMRRTSSNSPGSTILKGTPKPVVVVKSKQAAPAPPLPAKEKPKIPAKPRILLAKNASANAAPAAAPRRGPSFSQADKFRDSPAAAEYAAECYSTQADAQNEVIFEVNATRVKGDEEEKEEEEEEEGGDGRRDETEEERQERNRNALDEIKKSLEASRCDDGDGSDGGGGSGQDHSMSSYTSSSLSSASSAMTTASASSTSTSSRDNMTRCSVAT